MFKARIGLLLHFYQPWWQYPEVLDKIVRECYRPIFKWVNSRPGFAFSANINWSLIELLMRHGHDDLIEGMAQAVRDGKVELFGTAAHHPILPLLNETEQDRQLRFDRESKRLIGFPNAGNGVYLPEYAWGANIVAALKRSGCQFTLTDDLLFAHVHNGTVPFNRIPLVDGLAVFLRSRYWGNKLSFGEYDFDRLANEMPGSLRSWFGDSDGYVILATDAETFGHHQPKLIDHLLVPLIENWPHGNEPIGVAPFREIYDLYAHLSQERDVPAGSWSTEIKDYHRRNFYPLWDCADHDEKGQVIPPHHNKYHQALWKLVNIARQFGDDSRAAEDVLKMLSSCAWWQVAFQYGPGLNTKLMMFGAKKALEIIERVGDVSTRREGNEAFEEILKLPGVYRDV
jgi:hypothetical protein